MPRNLLEALIMNMKKFKRMPMKIYRQSAYANISIISDEEIRIDYIESGVKREGHATNLMLYILSMAQCLKQNVSLLPVANSGLPRGKLKAWYASFGFVEYESGMIWKYEEENPVLSLSEY